MKMEGWSDPIFAPIGALLKEHAGLEFPPNRQCFAEAGIRRAMAKVGIERPAIYLEKLESGAVSIEDLAAEVGVRETYFFRDPIQFETIRTRLLPDLIARRGPMPAPRIWSAGCATGEEAYSLAILLEEQRVAIGARIYGTDVSEAALSAARRGVFTSWSLRGDAEGIAARYFHHRGDRFALKPDLRRRVEFSRLNLAGDDPFPSAGNGLDIILCRNVLIYFSAEAVRRVGQRLLQSLAPGGWLVTGASDPLLPAAPPYEAVLTPGGIFYRHGTSTQSVIRLRAPRSHEERRASPAKPGTETISRVMKPAPNPVSAGVPNPAMVAVARVRELGDLGLLDEAESLAAEESARHPFCVELHFLHGMLLMERGRYEATAGAMRRVLYLDPNLAAAQLSLGWALQRLGSRVEAWSAYQRGHAIATRQPPDAIMPLSDGACAKQLASAAKDRMTALDADGAYSS